MSKQHQIHKQEETKRIILDAAREIVSKEGVQGLSIRKITKALDYSPGIIYHYFKNKSEIVENLVSEGYSKILASIRSVKRNEEEPEQELKDTFTNYIKTALKFPEEYKAFMLNEDPSVLMRTGLLEKGISEKSQSVKMLRDNIERGMRQGRYKTNDDPELIAQIVWTSTFGLITKLIIEKEIPEEQVNRLINQHFRMILNGILNG